MKFGSLDKMKITSSEPKDYMGRSGKEFIASMGLNINVSSNNNKRSRYSITNVCMKYLSNITKEFENFALKRFL